MGLFLGALLSPWTSPNLRLYKGKVPPPNFFVIIPVLAILLIIGFIITVIAEGFVIARRFPQKGADIIPAAIIMNIFSYAALLLVAGLSIWGMLFI